MVQMFRTTEIIYPRVFPILILFFWCVFFKSVDKIFKTRKYFKIVILPTLSQTLTSELRGKGRIWGPLVSMGEEHGKPGKVANCPSQHRWL